MTDRTADGDVADHSHDGPADTVGGGPDATDGPAGDSGAGDSVEPLPAAKEAVGDGRKRHVEVVTTGGDRHEHGDAFVREDVEAFYVSPEAAFPPGETSVYEKEDLARVSIDQHHSMCFITTAVAGEEETLATLRGFRDESLRPSPVGRPLVGVYEALSPPIADTLARHPDGRTAVTVRWLVRRCAGLARRRDDAGPVAAAALSVVLTLLYVVGVTVAAAGHLATRAGERVGE